MRDKRQRHDHFFKKARAQGYAARSVFKLEEIDARHGLCGPGRRVLDLGCAPGSWLAYVARRVGPTGRAVGLDRAAVTIPLPSQVVALVGDVRAVPVETLREAAGGPLDLVLSDMAPDTSGVAFADAARSVELADRALELALELLAPGGAFLVKVFQGAELSAYLDRARAGFRRVELVKPAASRKQSREIYVLALHRRSDGAGAGGGSGGGGDGGGGGGGGCGGSAPGAATP
jgi:23S rRNA (uridine2552-2'-O)-methyltransferase